MDITHADQKPKVIPMKLDNTNDDCRLNVEATFKLIREKIGEVVTLEDVKEWYKYYDIHVVAWDAQLAQLKQQHSKMKYIVLKKSETGLKYNVEYRGKKIYRIHIYPEFGQGRTKIASLHLDMFKNMLLVKSKVLLPGSRRLKNKYKTLNIAESSKEAIYAEVSKAFFLRDDPNAIQILSTEEYEKETAKGTIKKMAIYTEYMEEGTLDDIGESFDKETKLKVMSDICRVVARFHGTGLVHRDLKPSNIFVTCINGQYRAIVADFGLAEKENELTSIAGTAKYMAPELRFAWLHRLNGYFTCKVDCYAMGVLFYELWFQKKVPWDRYSFLADHQTKAMEMMADVDHNVFADVVPAANTVEWVIRALLGYTSEKRMSAAEAYDELNKLGDGHHTEEKNAA